MYYMLKVIVIIRCAISRPLSFNMCLFLFVIDKHNVKNIDILIDWKKQKQKQGTKGKKTHKTKRYKHNKNKTKHKTKQNTKQKQSTRKTNNTPPHPPPLLKKQSNKQNQIKAKQKRALHVWHRYNKTI